MMDTMGMRMNSRSSALRMIRTVAVLGIAVLFAPAGVAGDCATDKAFADQPVLKGKACGRNGEKMGPLSQYGTTGTTDTVGGGCSGAPYDC